MQILIALAKVACVKLFAGFVNSRLMAESPGADELTPRRHPDGIANGMMCLRRQKCAGQRFCSEAVDGRVARRRESILRRGMDQPSDDPRMSDGLPMARAL
ncbi:MAG: hypothetical protein QGG71_08840 [Pirellulaceae bacterium]|jgi:hypothetical protein|nr:hypothetical protein [Planctomycetaceae bacterium]MDP6554760.1 hypothetical protein [Pirellulaceae bacterium]